MQTIYAIAALILILGVHSTAGLHVPVVANGLIDLRGVRFDRGELVQLNGDWKFYPHRFVEDLHRGDSLSPVVVHVPGSWRNSVPQLGGDVPFGYGTYKVTVLVPPGVDSLTLSAPNVVNSYRVYCNGSLVGSVGTPGRTAAETESRISSRLLTFACSDTTIIEIDVANFQLNSGIIGGGIVGEVTVGSGHTLEGRAEKAIFVDIFLIGGFSFVTIFLLVFFLVYRKDLSYLYFSFFIGAVTIRFISSNSKFVFEKILNDSVSWAWMQSFELLGFYLGAAALVLYVYSFFGSTSRVRTVVKWMVIADLIFSAIVLCTPPQIYMLTLHPFQLFTLFHIGFTLFLIGTAYRHKRERVSAKLIGISLAIFFVFVVIDMLNASLFHGALDTYFSAQGLTLFVIFQAWVLAAKYMRLFDDVSQAKQVSEHHLKIIEMYTRKTIVDIINNGRNPLDLDASSIHTCILFSDIRDFTAFAEDLSPMETVSVLNRYFTAMSDCISRNGGEIDKLIGDCIMALFSDSDAAVNASVEMRQSLRELNGENKKVRLYNGVGINFGEVIIGNIGSENKLDYTVIGDSVNSASRIESLTKYYKLPILISDEIRSVLTKEHTIRFVDRVLVKGKREPISIYEVYDHEPEEIKAIKAAIEPRLTAAYELYQKADFAAALAIYRELRAEVGPHSYLDECCVDPIIDFNIDRCENLLAQLNLGLLHSWDGVFEFQDK